MRVRWEGVGKRDAGIGEGYVLGMVVAYMGKMRPSWMRWMDELGVGPGRRAVEWW